MVADEDDFIQVEAKVPRRDRDGNEITAGDLGTGGARRDDGTLAALAYDLRPRSDDDDSRDGAGGLSPEMRQWLLRVGLVVLDEFVIPAAKEAAPHVKAHFQARYRGYIERRRARKADGGKSNQAASPDHRVSVEVADALPESRDIPDQPLIAMTPTEWEEGFRAWMAAATIEEALRELLANAHIEAEDEPLRALQGAVRELTPEQRVSVANRMLELDAFSLDDGRLATFVKVFGEGQVVDGQFVPMGLEESRDGEA